MKSDGNPYTTPQAPLIVLPRVSLNENDSRRFSWGLVLDGLRRGAIAGLIASSVMLFVFVLKISEEQRGELPHLLAICGWFIAVTSALGLFWGLNHAVIDWCLARWPAEMRY